MRCWLGSIQWADGFLVRMLAVPVDSGGQVSNAIPF